MLKRAIWVTIIAVAVITAWAALRRQTDRSTPTADGQILHSEVITQKIQRLSFGSNESFTDQYEIGLTYEYSLSGARFVGHNLYVKAPAIFGRKDTAEKMQAEYPVGKRVVVFYDRADPKHSWLVRESAFPIPSYLLLLLGLAALLVIIGLTVFLSQKSGSAAKPEVRSKVAKSVSLASHDFRRRL